MIVNAFTKTFDGRTVLDFPGFTFLPGKIYAVIGANGSGKSTFARVLAGILDADGGTPPVTDGSRVACMLQRNYAFRMSAYKNILIGENDPGKAESLIQTLGLAEVARSRAKRLSGGETQKMSLARVLIGSHDAVILDEPTASMDMESSFVSEALIRDYCRSQPAAVIMITHSLQQAGRMADEILYFHKGLLLEHGSAGDVLTCPQEKETQDFIRF